MRRVRGATAVPGFYVFPDFLTGLKQELTLLQSIECAAAQWENYHFDVPVAYRSKQIGRVLRARDTNATQSLIQDDEMLHRLVLQQLQAPEQPWNTLLQGFQPNHANFNDYYPKQGRNHLPLHYDDRKLHDGTICGISLLADTYMSFRKANNSEIVKVFIPRRSLYVMTGPARYEWQHGIIEHDNENERRVSVVLRHVYASEKKADSTKSNVSIVQSQNSLSKENSRSILVVTSNFPEIDVSGAGILTQSRLRCFVSGFDRVVLATTGRIPKNANKASHLGFEIRKIILNEEKQIERLLEDIKPDIVMFDGFNNEERFSHYIKRFSPRSLRVLDMQDFHSTRIGREEVISNGGTIAQSYYYTPKSTLETLNRELAAMHRSDVILCISQSEMNMMPRYGIPSQKLVYAPFSYENSRKESNLLGNTRRKGCLFIGNWRHSPNRDAAQYLVRHVWPRVYEKDPSIPLDIYGSHPTKQDMDLTHEGNPYNASVKGSCKNVESVMQKYKILVAPLRYGAGLKAKIIEAWRSGAVVITTPIGSEGLKSTDGVFAGIDSCTDPDRFASTIVNLYRDSNSLSSFQKQGLQNFHQWFSSDINDAALCEAILLHMDRIQTDQYLRSHDYIGSMVWSSYLRSTEWMARYLEQKKHLKSSTTKYDSNDSVES